jgi:hypothetical protein
MYHQHLRQGNYWCQDCRHIVSPQFGGCRTCRTPLDRLVEYDVLYNQGFFEDFDGPVSFDPFDGEFAFNIPGTDLAVEPDGEIDVQTPFGDMPAGDWF